MRFSLRQTIWIVLLFAGIGVLVFVAAAGSSRDRPVAISSTHATRQDLTSWASSNGKVEPVDPHIIQSQLTTRIEKVAVKEGQTVKTGDLLFRLDTAEVKSELAHMREQLIAAQQDREWGIKGGMPAEGAELENDLAKANADIARLKREGEALQRLYAGQAATRQELDQNRIALERAEADKRLIEEKKKALAERSQVQADRAALRADEARNSIASLEEKVRSERIVAPASGTVYSLSVRTPSLVKAGDMLAELADLSRVRVRVFVDEPDLGSLKVGQAVEITWDALPNRVWTGTVQQLPTTIVTRGSRNVGEVLCSVENQQSELLPNTNVNVRIRTADRPAVLAVPRAAVRSDANKRYVFLVKNGRLEKREVTVGIANLTDYEILAGINEGDLIALQGNTDLHEGMMVSALEQK
jgi:HlyD family secretion protein